MFRLVAAALSLVLPSVVSSLAPRTGPPATTRSSLFQPTSRNLPGAVGSESHPQHAPTARIRSPLFASQNNNNSWTSPTHQPATATISSSSNGSRRKRKGLWAVASTALAGASSGTLGVNILARGGTANTLLGPVQVLLQLAVHAFARFSNFMGASKTRCFLMLLCSILLECYATTLSKRAKDTGQVLVFLHACSLYLMWYVGYACFFCAFVLYYGVQRLHYYNLPCYTKSCILTFSGCICCLFQHGWFQY